MTKARILLKAYVSGVGEGWSGSRMAQVLHASIPKIERARRRLVEEGLDADFTRKANPDSGRLRILDGASEAKLITPTCGPAPAGYAKWNLGPLEDKVVELQIIENVGDNATGGL